MGPGDRTPSPRIKRELCSLSYSLYQQQQLRIVPHEGVRTSSVDSSSCHKSCHKAARVRVSGSGWSGAGAHSQAVTGTSAGAKAVGDQPQRRPRVIDHATPTDFYRQIPGPASNIHLESAPRVHGTEGFDTLIFPAQEHFPMFRHGPDQDRREYSGLTLLRAHKPFSARTTSAATACAAPLLRRQEVSAWTGEAEDPVLRHARGPRRLLDDGRGPGAVV